MKSSSAAGRRAFIGRAGAAVAGTVALAGAQIALSSPARPHLEAIRQLHREYMRRLNAGALEQLPELFDASASVWFSGGIFEGRDRGVRRLFVQHFGGRLRPEPVHVRLLEHPHVDDFIDVASDDASARARFQCLVQVQSTFQSALTIVEMARQQGQGAAQWWEVGRFDNSYARSAECWRMTALRYRSLPLELMSAGLRARPDSVPAFDALYPLHPAGPDRLEPDPG